MPRSTTTEKLVCALYTHGPCGAGTLAALIDEKDSRVVESALRPMVPAQVATRTVAMSGQEVQLFYLVGNGVG